MQTTRDDLLVEVASARAAARASTLVSVASLLVAAMALAINLYPTPARGLPAAPTEKYLDASRHYVTLAELAVYQDQIKDGAVGPRELEAASVTDAAIATGAVTASKLARAAVTTHALAGGAVTFDKISSGALVELKQEVTNSVAQQVARQVQAAIESPAVPSRVFGEVNADGTVAAGRGFTADLMVEGGGTGNYRIVFDPPFARPPVVTVSAEGYAVCMNLNQQAPNTVSVIRVKCMSDLIYGSAKLYSVAFSFVAFAPSA